MLVRKLEGHDVWISRRPKDPALQMRGWMRLLALLAFTCIRVGAGNSMLDLLQQWRTGQPAPDAVGDLTLVIVGMCTYAIFNLGKALETRLSQVGHHDPVTTAPAIQEHQ